MNPNANAFNPNAASFTPSWLPPAATAPAQPEPPADSWDDEEPAPAPEVAPVEDSWDDGADEPEPAPAPDPEPASAAADASAADTAVDEPAAAAAEPHPEAEEYYSSDEDVEPEREPGDHRKHVNVVFIGHVDAGKSTLCGQIMWQSGNLDERQLQKFEDDAKARNRESWKFAYAMDENEEERAKGKTVEVGRSFFATENKRYTVLDAPGHKNFVPHMIGGASQADVGVLVIAARKGEFETGFEKGGQTREHITLAKTAGVKQLICVINKMDDKTVEWSKERYDECVDKLSPFMKQAGFRPKKDVQWLPISALNGINVKETVTKDVCPWYDGASLLETLDLMPPPERLLEYPARLAIIDKFSDMGVIIMGKLQSGTITKGQKMIICPVHMPLVVQEIEVHGQIADICEPGDNVKMKVVGPNVNIEQIEAGFIMCPVKSPCNATKTFDAQVRTAACRHSKITRC